MAHQELFLRFHERIRLEVETHDHLRRKRDILCEKIAERLPFRRFNQGSYAMGTGVWPIAGREVDIDVGLVFEIDPAEWHPVELKRAVLEPVLGHTTRGQRIGRYCVTVTYARTHQQPPCHVDLAVYANGPDGLSIAVGKRHTPVEEQDWLPSDPRGLLRVFRQRLDGDARQQLRRVIRYLKRWKDFNFPAAGKGAPTGIALTAAALNWFEPCPDDDLRATLELVRKMSSNVWPRIAYGFRNRLILNLPVAPYSDVFERMTDPQMCTFAARLDMLGMALERAPCESSRAALSSLESRLGYMR